jgi:hypothetical protein
MYLVSKIQKNSPSNKEHETRNTTSGKKNIICHRFNIKKKLFYFFKSNHIFLPVIQIIFKSTKQT